MPREAARIFLRVLDVRIERLQKIMDDPPGPNNQVVREGCLYGCDFIAAWNHTIKPANLAIYGWHANPWVWVIEFERVKKEDIAMNINRLLEITNDLERCALCPDKDYGCEHCNVDPDTQEELREYYQQVKETLSEHDALKAENAKLRSKLKTMGEEYLETCSSDCAGDQESGIFPCKNWVAPDVDENNTPTEGYCSIRAELKEE